MKYRAVGIRNVIGFFNGMVLYFTFYVTVFILEKKYIFIQYNE